MRFFNTTSDKVAASKLSQEILDSIEFNELDLKYDKDDDDILETLIPSRDVREYLEKIHFEVTPFIKAGLITRSHFPVFMEIDELRKVQASLFRDDICLDDELFNQIEDYIRRLEYTYKVIVDNYDKDCFYVIYRYYEDRSVDERGIFLNYADAREFASKAFKGQDFYITKSKIVMDKSEISHCIESDNTDMNELSTGLGTLDFDSVGQLMHCYSPNVQMDKYSNDAFYMAYTFIPFPFRNGDIIRDLSYDYSENNLGIIVGPKDDDEMYGHYILGFQSDYTDYIINYETLFDEESIYGDWGYEHGNPLYLEFADKDNKFKDTDIHSLEYIYYKAKRVKQGDDMFMSLKLFIDDWRKSKSDKPKE